MKAPVFVKIDQYKEVEETISQIKSKIHEANEILEKLSGLKADEEKEIQNWHGDIKQIEDKISTIEHSMAQ